MWSPYYEARKDDYRIGEQRKIRVPAARSRAGAAASVAVPPTDVQRYYNDNIQQYQTPEQVRASHILLKTDGKDEAAVRKQAEDLLAKIKAGADFAELAKKFSEDAGTKDKGGDLDFFPRGQHGAGVRDRGICSDAGAAQRHREVAVRLPHHQSGRQAGRHDATARRGPSADSADARRRRLPTSQITERRPQLAERASRTLATWTRWPPSLASRCRNPGSSSAPSRCRDSARRRKSRTRPSSCRTTPSASRWRLRAARSSSRYRGRRSLTSRNWTR